MMRKIKIYTGSNIRDIYRREQQGYQDDSTSVYATFVVWSLCTKNAVLRGSPQRDAATYSCPWVNTGSSSRTPTRCRVWPCALLMVMATAQREWQTGVCWRQRNAWNEQNIASIFTTRNLGRDVPRADTANDVPCAVAVTARRVHVSK